MASTHKRSIPARIFAVLLGVVLIAAVAGTAWVGTRALLAERHLQEARGIASSVTSTALSNPDESLEALDQLRDETSAAHALTNDPVWDLAEGLPWVGPQLHAVSATAKALDDVVAALAPLIDDVAAIGIDSFAPSAGVVDTSVFEAIEGSASAAADGSSEAAATIEALDTTPLVGPVRAALEEASSLLSSVAGATDALARATELIPLVLGAEGPRDYLVLFQNNAEWRSLGGLVGSVALLHTEDGSFSLAAQASGGSLGTRTDPPVALDDEVLTIYDTRAGRFPANVTQLPDFSLAAPQAREYWRLNYGQEADGVLAIDPVGLSYLLDVVGPVTLPTGDTLTAANAVQLMLNEVYLRYEDPAAQNAFFEVATASVFEAISSRALDPIGVVSALGRAADERRLFVWSSRADEQAILDGTTLQGSLPETDSDATRFGIYVNDGTGSKMDYYLRLQTQSAWCSRVDDDSEKATAALRVTIRNDAPADIAESTLHITGGGLNGVPPGVTRTVTYVYLPEGSASLRTSAAEGSTLRGDTHNGRPVLTWATDLSSGESATLDIAVDVRRTPLLQVVKTATLEQLDGDASDLCTG